MAQPEQKDTLAKARAMLAAEPWITGAELGRRLGFTTRHGQNIRQQLAQEGDHVTQAESLLAASHEALKVGNGEMAARLATVASAHALIYLARELTGDRAVAMESDRPSDRALALLPEARRLDVTHFSDTGEPISANKIRKALSIGSDLAGELHRLLRDGTAYEDATE